MINDATYSNPRQNQSCGSSLYKATADPLLPAHFHRQPWLPACEEWVTPTMAGNGVMHPLRLTFLFSFMLPMLAVVCGRAAASQQL
jgi:hypothetical protein